MNAVLLAAAITGTISGSIAVLAISNFFVLLIVPREKIVDLEEIDPVTETISDRVSSEHQVSIIEIDDINKIL